MGRMRRGLTRWASSLALAAAWGMASPVQAQTPPIPPPSPPPANAAAPSVEDRLRKLEEVNRLLLEQNQKLQQQMEILSRQMPPAPDTSTGPRPDASPNGDAGGRDNPAGTTGGGEKGTGGDTAPAAGPPNGEPSDRGDRGTSSPATGAGGASGSMDAEKPDHGYKSLVDSLHHDDNYGLKSLFDSLHPHGDKGKPWYEKLSIRGYTQVRFGRTLYQDADGADPTQLGAQDPNGADPSLLGDRSINGNAENFSIRRARLILFGDVSDHLSLYFQQDFSNTPPGSSAATFFGQLRDLYADVYIDKTRVNRFRVGLSKIPYGWENMQSSQNRVPLDRTDAINTGASPNERDLGVFYYWTPEKKQDLLKELVDGGLKGSGNYGIFGLGVYNGQGGSQLEKNLNLHTVARFTYPFRLRSGQVMEAGVQGYTGEYVVSGAGIRPLGRGDEITPAGTGGTRGLRDQRIAGTFVYYPQPFGIQAEWNVGQGPGLNDAQTAVEVRSLRGGYVMGMYKLDTDRFGIFTPYVRYQHYRGGYRSVANAPYGNHDQWDLGVEWQIRKEMELVTEYSFVNGVNLNANDEAGFTSYRNFDGGVLRAQFQFNY